MLVPGCGMHSKEVRPHSAESNSATWMSAILLKLELAGVVQLTVNAQTSSRSFAGRPAGPWDLGVAVAHEEARARRPAARSTPSRSAGVSAWKPKPESEGAVRRWKVADRPANMRMRSRA